MIYDLTNKVDIQNLKDKLNELYKQGELVEFKKYSPKRSLKHNAYLHLILSYFAIEYGETLKYVKEEIFKKQVNPDVFETEHVNPVTGEVRTEWKSTADLSDKELSMCISRFHDFSAKECGIALPDSKRENDLVEVQKMVKNNEKWLY